MPPAMWWTGTGCSPCSPPTSLNGAYWSGGTVVVTVMTNLGFHEAMAAAGVNVHTVGVGDRYVLEALDANGWALGGEQSGHIVFRSLATTGDGVLSGLLLADLVSRQRHQLGRHGRRRPAALAPGAAQRGCGRPGRLGRSGGGVGRGPGGGTEPGPAAAGCSCARAGPSHWSGSWWKRPRKRRRRRPPNASSRPCTPPWAAQPAPRGAAPLPFVYMCGIVAVLAQPSSRPVPGAGQVEEAIADALSQLGAVGTGTGPADQLSALRAATATLDELERVLARVPGLTCLICDSAAAGAVQRGAAQMQALVAGYEAALDAGASRRGHRPARGGQRQPSCACTMQYGPSATTGSTPPGPCRLWPPRSVCSPMASGRDRAPSPCCGRSRLPSARSTASRSGGGTPPACT